ncbi:putative GTPase MTG1 [Sugiyamaella lignohabitans]|uniref:Putative GTPase MTG1 n=1 Tax=Sugiyamaella lignohabitans TaxID=796027 RepID=A0A167EBJ2_9ASCO|nr:putative GTPase MTG1 [Sugiyamaella lignohabitans]ANB13873.1 putative GTPase MTG1 [Sugiyamaella lignohabitans]
MSTEVPSEPTKHKFVPRPSFPDYNIPLANFHGHHRKALQSMHQTALQVDLVLELRDSRAPLSSINLLFDKVLGHKNKLVLYTKNDLSGIKNATELYEAWHPHQKFLNIDCRSTADANKVLSAAKQLYDELEPKPPLGLRLLITGMPNAGKSTFLNTLRKVGTGERHKVASTGEMPGVTRSISETIRISRDPNIYIFDTPGVFVPQVKNSEDMLKMCLINAVKRSHVDPVVLADYLLYRINKQYPDGKPYLKYTGRPTNNIDFLLRSIVKRRLSRRNSATKDNNKAKASNNGDKSKGTKIVDFNENGEALDWIEKWTKGKGPKIVLDDVNEPDCYAKTIEEQQTRLSSFDLGPLKVKSFQKKRLMLR